ncbi:FixH family protein [Rheinheimera sp. F8]|uniref:FixH family protein n=1 Tax=Rheinheimera sp. F8 TaxID=1763998 RepID=UPI00074490D8|nr:FixH family protein [Rheinheimera sp. F8]ALZ77034.1 nitrogen fixation protein FixH [Rheinheimera sp. F8]
MSKPWYKQAWPWILISLPVFSVLKAVHTVYIMNQQSPDLVVDDYYAEGKAVNQNLSRYREAAARNLHATVLLAGNKAILTFDANSILETSVTLDFVHNTLAAKDFKVIAHRSGESMYIAELPLTPTGKWSLVVHDNANQWKLRASLSLPAIDAIQLTY